MFEARDLGGGGGSMRPNIGVAEVEGAAEPDRGVHGLVASFFIQP